MVKKTTDQFLDPKISLNTLRLDPEFLSFYYIKGLKMPFHPGFLVVDPGIFSQLNQFGIKDIFKHYDKLMKNCKILASVVLKIDHFSGRQDFT